MPFQTFPRLIDDRVFGVHCSVHCPCQPPNPKILEATRDRLRVDTTEEEKVPQEENDCPTVRRGWGTTLGSIEEDARPDLG